MGSLAGVIRLGIGILNDITVAGGIQVTVIHRAYVAQDALGDGEPYAAPVSRTAVLKQLKHMLHGINGSETQDQSQLLFVGPVAITTNDHLTLPDGTTPPILEVNGVWDQGGAGRYYTVVKLGQDVLPRQNFSM